MSHHDTKTHSNWYTLKEERHKENLRIDKEAENSSATQWVCGVCKYIYNQIICAIENVVYFEWNETQFSEIVWTGK